MTEHPILFNGPMVRAVLDGRKTQTRRPMRVQPTGASADGYERPWFPGDRLWVRETWMSTEPDLERARATHEDLLGNLLVDPPIYYRATETHPEQFRWRPSIHMPRWACRIELEVVRVWAERVQDISEADAGAEGSWLCPGYCPGRSYPSPSLCGFYAAWNSIYGKRGQGWDENPWVWATEFQRLG